MIPRRPTHFYRDPLDLIWIRAAEYVGWRIERNDDVYASFDGNGTLTICNPPHFDPDDSIAQYILHELCHALVAGPERLRLPNFGLENADERHLLYEEATHRVQAELTRRHGLRGMLRPTSEYRYYFDSLPELPLVDDGDPAVPLAREAAARAESEPWCTALNEALAATAAIAEQTYTHAPLDSVFARNGRPSEERTAAQSYAELRCDDCTWRSPDADYHCEHHPEARSASAVATRVGDGACPRFERRLSARDCGACGACCREGFHLVEVRSDEPFAQRHPELLVRDAWGSHLPRLDGRCSLLRGGSGTPYLCARYTERPESCRDFELSGPACLEARRRCGMSGGKLR